MTVQCFFWDTPNDVQPLVEKYADVQQTFDWDESKHPRDADGKFASKSTPTESTKKAAPRTPRRGTDQLSRQSVANQRALNAVFSNAFVDVSQIEDPTIRDILAHKVDRKKHPTSRSKKMPLEYMITARKDAKQSVVQATSEHLQKHGADEFLDLIERETVWADDLQPGYHDPWAQEFVQGGKASETSSDWTHRAVLESPYKDVLFWASHKNPRETKGSKFTKLSKAERIENVTQRLIDTWARTSGDSDVLSLALQQAAIEEFDLPERVSETESVLLDTDQAKLKQRVRDLGGGPAALFMPREFAKEIARYPDLFGQTSQVDVAFNLDDGDLTVDEKDDYQALLRRRIVEHPATRQRSNVDVVAVRFDDAIDAYTAKQAMHMLTRSQRYGTEFDIEAEATEHEVDLYHQRNPTSWPIDLTSDQADVVFDESLSDGERASKILKYCDPDKVIKHPTSRYRNKLFNHDAYDLTPYDLTPESDARKRAVQTLKTMNRAALNTAAKLLAKRHRTLLGQFLRVQHQRTQKALDALPGDSVTLYRGLEYPIEDAPTDWDVTPGRVSNVELSTNALSSWSTDQDVAESFADNLNNLPQEKYASFVLEMTVPKSSILATPLTGIGCLSEQECVVVGRSHNAHAYSFDADLSTFRNFFSPDATEEHKHARDNAPLPSVVKSVLEASGSPIHPTLAAETDPHVSENYAASKWDESKHPRDADGKFASKSTPTKTKNKHEKLRPPTGTNELSVQSVANRRTLNAVFANAFVDSREVSKFEQSNQTLTDLKDSSTISMPYVLQATARRNAKKAVVDTTADELVQAGAIDDFVERAKRQWAVILEQSQAAQKDLSEAAPFDDRLAIDARRPSFGLAPESESAPFWQHKLVQDINVRDRAYQSQLARRHVKDVTQQLVDTWAHTSGDSDVLSLALQQAAIEEFDLPERVSETETVLLDTDQENVKQTLQRFHDGPAAILMPRGFAKEIARYPDLFGQTSYVELPTSSQSDELEQQYQNAVKAWTLKSANKGPMAQALKSNIKPTQPSASETVWTSKPAESPASTNVVAMRFDNAIDAHNAQLAMECLERPTSSLVSFPQSLHGGRWPRPLTSAQADAMFDANATPQQRAEQIVEHFSPKSNEQHNQPYSDFFVEQMPPHHADHWKTAAMDDLQLLRERFPEQDKEFVHPDNLSALEFVHSPQYDELMNLIYDEKVNDAVAMLKRNKDDSTNYSDQSSDNSNYHLGKIEDTLRQWVEAGQTKIEDNALRVAINTAAKLLAKRHQKLLGQFLRVQYEKTQKALSALPGDSVTLYRGIGFDEHNLPDEWHNSMYHKPGMAAGVDISTNALSSWTTDHEIAMNFSSHKDTKYPFVMEMTVPKSSILATPLTGIGCLNEQECVVVGRSHRANVRHAEEVSERTEVYEDGFFISSDVTDEHSEAYRTPPEPSLVQQVLTDAGSPIHEHFLENTE